MSIQNCFNWCVMCTGRIDRKIEFPLPDEKTRRRIFQIHTKKMTLAKDLDLEEYITAKDDLSGADVKVYMCIYTKLYLLICCLKITVLIPTRKLKQFTSNRFNFVNC